MVLTNIEINKLIAEQHNIYRELEKDSKNPDLQSKLLKITDAININTKEILSNTYSEITEIPEKEEFSAKDYRKVIKKKYQELINSYRDTVELVKVLRSVKKKLREYIRNPNK